MTMFRKVAQIIGFCANNGETVVCYDCGVSAGFDEAEEEMAVLEIKTGHTLEGQDCDTCCQPIGDVVHKEEGEAA